MHIKPAPGLRVRDPDLRDFLPDEGRVVPDTAYWRRRLRDGDVVHVAKRVSPAPRAPEVRPAEARQAPARPATRPATDAPGPPPESWPDDAT